MRLYLCRFRAELFSASLETPDEAVLGRIASFSSEGKLSFGSGEEFNIRAVREERPIPEDLREQYLKYRINIRVLGVLRKNGNGLTFVPSHRRLPHVGSKVAFPSAEVLREIAGHNIDGAPIEHQDMGCGEIRDVVTRGNTKLLTILFDGKSQATPHVTLNLHRMRILEDPDDDNDS